MNIDTAILMDSIQTSNSMHHSKGDNMTQEHNPEMPDATMGTTGISTGYSINLTQQEVLFIDDNLHLMIEAPGGPNSAQIITIRPLAPEPGIPVSQELIEKIGWAVLSAMDTENDGGQTQVIFDELELFLMREIAQSNALAGAEQVGLNLKKKVYSALWGEAHRHDKLSRALLSRAGLITDSDTVK